MDKNSSINFKVSAPGVQEFMDNFKKKTKQMTDDLIRGAQQETKSAKEQLEIINAQIKAWERKTRLAREIAEAEARQTAKRKIDTIDERGGRIDLLYEENKRRFRAGDIDRGTYFQRKRTIEGLAENNTESAINKTLQQQLRSINEQSRQQRLTTTAVRDEIETIRNASNSELREMRQGNDALIDSVEETADPQDRLANQLASEQRRKELNPPKDAHTDGGSGGRDSMLKFANAITIEKLGGMLANIPNTKNELDYLKPIMSTLGMAVGGLTGIAADALAGVSIAGFKLGDTSFGQLGMQVGEKLGEFAGSAVERSFKGREELTRSNYQLQALVGKDLGVKNFRVDTPGATGEISAYNQDLSKYGVDYHAVSALMQNVVQRKGNSSNLGRDTENVLAMQQGWGVRQDTSFAMMELARSNRESDRNIVNLIGGILQKGQGSVFKDGDRAFLNEFVVKNYTQLHKTLLSTQDRVASGTTMDVLTRFNALGGQWAANDSRSSGLINQIQGSLVNPGSDNLKALAFTMLRRDNPNMGIADLLEEQQKGLGSPRYLKAMLGGIDMIGGDEQTRLMNVAGMFGLQGNIAAARSIYNNRQKLMSGEISLEELKGNGSYSEGTVRALGQEQTGMYTRSTAEIENAFIRSAVEGVELVGSKMKTLMGDMMDGMSKWVKAEFDRRMGTSMGSTGSTNQTKSAFKDKKAEKAFQQMGVNKDMSLNMSSVANKF